MGWEVGESFKREERYVLIHVDVWQKPTQHCKAIILQLKTNTFKKPIYSKFCELQLKKKKNSGPGTDTGQGPQYTPSLVPLPQLQDLRGWRRDRPTCEATCPVDTR